MSGGERVTVALLRWAARAFPAGHRARDRSEMEEVFLDGVASARRRRGRWSGRMYAVRAVLDVLRAGFGERMRRIMRSRSPAGGRGPGRGGGGAGGGEALAGWLADARLAGRTLVRSPGFTAAAVTVLALGIGANTAVFSAVRAVLLAPLPFPEAERIVLLDITDSSTVRSEPSRGVPWSYPKFRILEARSDLLASPVAAYAMRSLTLTGAGDAALLNVEVITSEYLSVLGVAPALGRDLNASDDSAESPLVALLGHDLWASRFGGRPEVVGESVTLNGQSVTVLGVLPRGFRGLTARAEVWVPVHTASTLTVPFLVSGTLAHWLQGVGRLRPGATLEALDRQVDAVARTAEATYPDSDPTVVRGGSARPLEGARAHSTTRAALLVLSLAAGLLLLVACANLAGLVLARGTARRREMAMRAALGAGGWRVARLVLVECTVLAAMGSLAGIGVGWLATRGLARLWPDRFLEGAWNVRLIEPEALGLDPPVLAFAVGLGVLTGLLAGLLPALQATRASAGVTLRQGGTGSLGGTSRGLRSARGALVATEAALALVLLVGAGLLLRSLDRLAEVPRGVESGPMLVFSLAEPPGSVEERYLFRVRISDALGALPGVERVAIGCTAPLSGHCTITDVRRAGEREWPEGSRPDIGVHLVDDEYFATLGVPLLAGRAFGPDETLDAPTAVVLGERAARELFGEEDPVGREIEIGYSRAESDGGRVRVVGVVGDVLYSRPERGTMPDAYLSLRQLAGGNVYMVRTAGDPLATLPAVRAVVSRFAPDLPMTRVGTLSELERAAVAETRVLGTLLTLFGALAMLLAATGVWGVVAYGVSWRTKEIGLRMALGARADEVARLVLREGLLAAGVGVAAGTLLALAASRLLTGLLFGVEPADPVSFGVAALLILGVAGLSGWLPARRAARLDPARVLSGD